jgi:hypothetical protein
VIAVPRRWSEEIDGIRWLPRMIDKARMERAGTLGAYLLGHSPVDRALLARLGASTAAFSAIVAENTGDGAVLAALRARGFDEERVRRWSAAFEARYRYYLRLWDIDDGYAVPSALERACIGGFRAVEGPLMRAVRWVAPRA